MRFGLPIYHAHSPNAPGRYPSRSRESLRYTTQRAIARTNGTQEGVTAKARTQNLRAVAQLLALLPTVPKKHPSAARRSTRHRRSTLRAATWPQQAPPSPLRVVAGRPDIALWRPTCASPRLSMSAHTVLKAPKPALRAGARVAAGSSPTSASLRSKEAGSTTDAAHQRTGGQLAVHVATVSVSPPYRRHGPGCSQRCTACCLSVRVTVAALLFTCGVLCRGVDHPRRRAPRQSSAAASGAAAADSQALGPAAALSRTDFLRGTDSSIYPGQAPPAPGAGRACVRVLAVLLHTLP